MKEKIIYSILTATFIFLVANQFIFQKTNANTKVTWEYTTYIGSLENKGEVNNFNKLGADGWEFTDVQQSNEHNANSYFVFKRKKNE